VADVSPAELIERLASLHLDGLDALVVVACLVAIAVFQAAETGLLHLPAARAEEIPGEESARRWPGLGRLLTLWAERPDDVLTGIVVGTHTAQLALVLGLAVIVAESAVALSPGVAVVLGVTALLAIVVTELVARAVAKEKAELAIALTAPIVIVSQFMAWPLVAGLTRLSRLSARVVGGTAGASAPFVTEAEIAAMIALGRRTGAIDKVEGRMLTSVMELGETLVREVMVSRTEISALPLQAGWDEVMRVVREGGHSRLPVYDGTLDDIRGFIHTRDLLAGDIDTARFSLRRHLRPVEFVPELGRVRDLLRTFQRKKTHLAVVVDEFGGTAGIVALEDVLEEIVGPIQDEHDEEEAEITRLDDGHHRALGRASLYDLGEAIGVAFPEGGYDTLGGFLIARAGRMPRIGDRLAFGGHTFTVVEADERRVSRVDIERHASGGTTPPAPAAAGDIEAKEAAMRPGADDS
jgi:CBS domain containing-hemolysin-like protein